MYILIYLLVLNATYIFWTSFKMDPKTESRLEMLVITSIWNRCTHVYLFEKFFFFFIYHPKILKVYKTTTTVKLEYTKEIMSFVARKDTRSSSSHYERHITKI